VVQDGSLPAAHICPVEQQVRRGGVPVEVEVTRVQTEMCRCLEAAEQASAPSFAVVEGATREVTALASVVHKKVGRIVAPSAEVGIGSGAHVGCNLEVGETGAGGGPIVRRSGARHRLPWGLRVVNFRHQPSAEIVCSSWSLEHFLCLT
jgi:hypothetical protein